MNETLLWVKHYAFYSPLSTHQGLWEGSLKSLGGELVAGLSGLSWEEAWTEEEGAGLWSGAPA